MKIKHLSRIWWLLFLAGIIIGAVCAGLCIRKLQMSEVQSVLYVQQLKDAQYHIDEASFWQDFFKTHYFACRVITFCVCMQNSCADGAYNIIFWSGSRIFNDCDGGGLWD